MLAETMVSTATADGSKRLLVHLALAQTWLPLLAGMLRQILTDAGNFKVENWALRRTTAGSEG